MLALALALALAPHILCYLIIPAVQLLDIMTKTGVELDPVYTLKGVRGMLTEMATNPGRFQGNRVLYIHTGRHHVLLGGQGTQPTPLPGGQGIKSSPLPGGQDLPGRQGQGDHVMYILCFTRTHRWSVWYV